MNQNKNLYEKNSFFLKHIKAPHYLLFLSRNVRKKKKIKNEKKWFKFPQRNKNQL